MNELSRREMLVATAAAACLCSLADSDSLIAEEKEVGPTTTPALLDAGPKSNYAADGVTAKWMKAPNKVAVIRNGGKLYATTTICTHKGCTVKVAPTAGFICPCHKATFDTTGLVTKGPAKVSLLRYGISVDSNEHVIVDKSKSFTEQQWDDPASFLTIA